MKRIISLIVACLMLVAACPVLADATTTASIVSVEEGAVFTVGSAIPLMVETNESQIKRIDFYANGIKIPGTATDASKSVVWTPQVAGNYAITAVVTGQAGGTAAAAAVNVRINATDEVMVKTFDTEASFSDAYYNYGNSAVTDDAINSEYTKKSNYSVKWPLGTQNNLYLKGLNANRIGYTYLNYLIYSTHPVSVWSQLVDENLGYERPEQNKITSAGWISLNAGWNAVSVELTPTAIDKYMAAETRIATINNIRFRVDYSVKIPTGLINAGENLTTQTGLSDAVVYIDSAWLSKNAIAAPTATTVLDEKTDICNALDKMTINFSKEMDTATLVKENVTVEGATNGAFEDFTCTASPDAMVIDFTNNLAYGDTYTVSINENVKDAYGLSVSGDKEWNFTTIESCNNADPIVELSYPKSGESLTSNNVVVAANVTFDGNVDKVEFYKSDDTLLGTGTKGADGEYYCEVAGLTEGAYSVYAKVSFKAESTLSPKTTSAVSFNVADAVEYTLTGLKEGEEIVLNSTVKPVILRIVGINDTTGVSKVVYKVNGAEKATVASAPFTWDMPITSIDTAQSVSADVYTAGGKTSTQAVSYKAIYVSESERTGFGSKFDDTVQGTDFTPSTNGAAAGVFKAVYGRDGAYSYTYEDVTAIGGTGNAVKINVKKSSTSTALLYTQVAPLTNAAGANPRVLFSFDLFLPSTANYKATKDMITIKANKSGSTLMNVCDLSTLEKGKWHKFKVYFDLVSKTMTTNINENTYVETIDDAKITVYLQAASDGKAGAYLSFAPLQNELYIDNLYIARVLNSGYRTDSFVNGVNYTADAAGVDATVTVANRGTSAVNPAVLFALYNSDMKLVKAWVENTAVMANELKHINKYVAYNQNGETGSIVKAFCWNSMNQLVPVDSIR